MKNFFSNTIFTCIASILFINFSFCQTHNPITGWLHTNGTLILDANNNVICLNGINSTGMEWGAGNEWTGAWHHEHCADSTYGCYATPYQQTYPQEFDSIKSWGFNFVRLLISWVNLEPTMPVDSSGIIVHHWNQTYLDSLDIIVSQFSSRGIALILSMHQWAWSPFFQDINGILGTHGLGMPVWLYSNQNGITQTQAAQQFFVTDTLILPGYSVQQGYIDAYKKIIGRYVNNQMIIGADLFNEPPDQITFNLKKYYDTVGTAIHSVNPNLLLIVQDGVQGQFRLKKFPNISNAIYSFHMYPTAWSLPSPTSAHTQMQSHLDTAQAWNVPMLVGEFGQFGWADTLGWEADMKLMFDFCKQNNINWAFYAYQHWTHPLINNNDEVNDSLVQTLNAGMCASTIGIPVQSVSKNFITIYPNPFTTIVILELPVSNCQMKVFDAFGNIVFEKKLNSKHETLNFELPSGMYFYQVNDNKQFISTGKIIAE